MNIELKPRDLANIGKVIFGTAVLIMYTAAWCAGWQMGLATTIFVMLMTGMILWVFNS